MPRRAHALYWALLAGTFGFALPAAAEGPPANTLKEIFGRLGACWLPPPPRPGEDPGMQITVVLSFRRDGSLMGKPSIAYESHEVSDEDRARYETALATTLQRCTPMPFTEELGNAVAGRPLRIRFDARRVKSSERTPWLTTTTL